MEVQKIVCPRRRRTPGDVPLGCGVRNGRRAQLPTVGQRRQPVSV